MKVLVVGPSMRFLGGQAVQATRLVDELKADGNVDVAYLVVDPVLPKPLHIMQRVPLLRTVVTSVAYILTLMRDVWKYDVVHVFSASYWSFLLAPTPAMVVGRLFGKRVVLNYHSGEADDHLARWGWHAKPLMRLASVIVVPTEYLVEVFGRHGLTARAVPNHLATRAVTRVARTSPIPRFLSNRNFEVHYNVGAVIDAFDAVVREFPSAELVIAGGGSQKGLLRARVHELGLDTSCTFTGPVMPPTMQGLYMDADVYVNASLIDNMPLSILEAYATGVPVVTSDAGGIPWIAKDQVTALVVPAGDVQALAAAMRDTIVRQADASARVRAARAYVEGNFSWAAVRDMWMSVYSGDGPE